MNDSTLPPLPPYTCDAITGHAAVWTPDQMRAYALAAIASDRASRDLASCAGTAGAAPLARPVSGEAWQPIETAPKDGTAILVICDKALRPAPAVAHWSDTDGRGWLGGCASDWLDDVDAADQMYGYFPNATRWARIAPLPAAPTSTPSAAKKD